VEEKMESLNVGHLRRGSRKAQSHALGDIPQPKQMDGNAKFRRAFSGLPFKRSEADRYTEWGGHKHTSWNRKLRNAQANAPKGGEKPKGWRAVK